MKRKEIDTIVCELNVSEFANFRGKENLQALTDSVAEAYSRYGLSVDAAKLWDQKILLQTVKSKKFFQI